jgi:lipopolysaccharide transport system ATP-binding protein
VNQAPQSSSAGDAIVLEQVSKLYKIPANGRVSVRGACAVVWDALRGDYAARQSMFRHFEALKPTDIRIGRGEAVAIVGRNGSGKSTLLEMISGTLRPSTGRVTVNGSLSALLQLGSGFNPEFTGIENIHLNAAILGLDRDRTRDRMDDILAFADIGDFVHQPVKTYSSGMRMRLAFAVITAVDPDILIIDEALSVGDAFFQSRCVRWLEDFVARGKTFLCVSHDMFMIKRLCTRGIVLDDGVKVYDADVAEAANLYYRLHRKKPVIQRATPATGDTAATAAATGDPLAATGDDPLASAHDSAWIPLELTYKERTGDGRLLIERVRTRPDLKAGCQVGDWLEVEIDIRAHEPVPAFHCGFGLRDRSGQLIGGYHSFYRDETFSLPEAGAAATLRFALKLDLRPQLYLLVIGLAINHTTDDWHDIDCIWDCASFILAGPEPHWGLAPVPARHVAFRHQTPSTPPAPSQPATTPPA